MNNILTSSKCQTKIWTGKKHDHKDNASLKNAEPIARAKVRQCGLACRDSHARWYAPAHRRDPIDLLIESSAGRMPELLLIRSGDAAKIAGYLGKKEDFDEALADFSESYADQNELDHKALVQAVRDGRLQVHIES